MTKSINVEASVLAAAGDFITTALMDANQSVYRLIAGYDFESDGPEALCHEVQQLQVDAFHRFNEIMDTARRMVWVSPEDSDEVYEAAYEGFESLLNVLEVTQEATRAIESEKMLLGGTIQRLRGELQDNQ